MTPSSKTVIEQSRPDSYEFRPFFTQFGSALKNVVMVTKFTGSATTTSYHLAPALIETAQCVETIWPRNIRGTDCRNTSHLQARKWSGHGFNALNKCVRFPVDNSDVHRWIRREFSQGHFASATKLTKVPCSSWNLPGEHWLWFGSGHSYDGWCRVILQCLAIRLLCIWHINWVWWKNLSKVTGDTLLKATVCRQSEDSIVRKSDSATANPNPNPNPIPNHNTNLSITLLLTLSEWVSSFLTAHQHN